MNKDVQLLQEVYNQVLNEEKKWWEPFKQGKYILIKDPLEFIKTRVFPWCDLTYSEYEQVFMANSDLGRAIIPWEKTKTGTLKLTPKMFSEITQREPFPDEVGYTNIGEFDDEFDDEFEPPPSEAEKKFLEVTNKRLNSVLRGLHVGSMIGISQHSRHRKHIDLKDELAARVIGITNSGMIMAKTNFEDGNWYFSGSTPDDEITVNVSDITSYNWI